MTAIRTIGILLASLALISIAHAQKGKPGGGGGTQSCAVPSGTYAAVLREVIYARSNREEEIRRSGLVWLTFDAASESVSVKRRYSEVVFSPFSVNQKQTDFVGEFYFDTSTCTGRVNFPDTDEVSAPMRQLSFRTKGSVSLVGISAFDDTTLPSFISSNFEFYPIGSCPRELKGSFTSNFVFSTAFIISPPENIVGGSHGSATGTAKINTAAVPQVMDSVFQTVWSDGNFVFRELLGEGALAYDRVTCSGQTMSIEGDLQSIGEVVITSSGKRLLTGSYQFLFNGVASPFYLEVSGVSESSN